MQEYVAEHLVHLVSRIEYVKEQSAHHNHPNKKWPPEERQKVKTALEETRPYLAELGLNSTKVLVEHFIAQWDSSDNVHTANSAANAIRACLADELKLRKFFVLDLDDAKFYASLNLAGETVRNAWPNANLELTEAGKCFALNQPKACVFHCCLALEAGLVALGKRLRVTNQNNWNQWIIAIKNALKTKFAKRVRDRAFYADCAERFDAIRISRRNPVSHYGISSAYTEQESKEILDSTCAFLRLLSTKLKE